MIHLQGHWRARGPLLRLVPVGNWGSSHTVVEAGAWDSCLKGEVRGPWEADEGHPLQSGPIRHAHSPLCPPGLPLKSQPQERRAKSEEAQRSLPLWALRQPWASDGGQRQGGQLFRKPKSTLTHDSGTDMQAGGGCSVDSGQHTVATHMARHT